jgi:cyclomaltodextrinase / maltogenic alpha-amylase / neopullulanase
MSSSSHPNAANVGRYWLREFDIDGYRLDYANGPGPDFWGEFNKACKSVRPDCFCFGEIVETPDHMRHYVGRLDGCLDFHVCEMLRRTFARRTRTEDDLARFVQRHAAYFPRNFIMPTFIDNHDMDRFLFIAGGDRDALRRAVTAQMRLPGPPIIYYGTEVGLEQKVSKTPALGLDVCRLPMRWDAQDRDLFAFYREIIRERRTRG